MAATKDHDIGTTNLHIEVSDVVNILVYVGIARGNGVLSKSGNMKLPHCRRYRWTECSAPFKTDTVLQKATKEICKNLLTAGRFFVSRVCTHISSI